MEAVIALALLWVAISFAVGVVVGLRTARSLDR